MLIDNSHFETIQEIDVVVYEGERAHVDANNKLGSFVISGVQRARAGEPKVDVSFALDANGILNVSARDQVTQAEARAEIKAEKGRLTTDDIDKMIADAEMQRSTGRRGSPQNRTHRCR